MTDAFSLSIAAGLTALAPAVMFCARALVPVKVTWRQSAVCAVIAAAIVVPSMAVLEWLGFGGTDQWAVLLWCIVFWAAVLLVRRYLCKVAVGLESGPPGHKAAGELSIWAASIATTIAMVVLGIASA